MACTEPWTHSATRSPPACCLCLPAGNGRRGLRGDCRGRHCPLQQVSGSRRLPRAHPSVPMHPCWMHPPCLHVPSAASEWAVPPSACTPFCTHTFLLDASTMLACALFMHPPYASTMLACATICIHHVCMCPLYASTMLACATICIHHACMCPLYASTMLACATICIHHVCVYACPLYVCVSSASAPCLGTHPTLSPIALCTLQK